MTRGWWLWPLLLVAVLLTAGLVSVVEPATSASTGCPVKALPFTANPISPAVAAVLRRAKSTRLSITAAVVAPSDTARGREVRTRCGPRAWRRTVVVYAVDLALLPSASLSQRVYLVSRFGTGYQVWERVR